MSRIWKICLDCGFKTWHANSYHQCPSVKNRRFPKMDEKKIFTAIEKNYPNMLPVFKSIILSGQPYFRKIQKVNPVK